MSSNMAYNNLFLKKSQDRTSQNTHHKSTWWEGAKKLNQFFYSKEIPNLNSPKEASELVHEENSKAHLTEEPAKQQEQVPQIPSTKQ